MSGSASQNDSDASGTSVISSFPFLNVITHAYLHFGQNSGKRINSVSSRTSVRVFLPQRGQSRKFVVGRLFIFAAHLRPELPQFRSFVTQDILYRVHGGFLLKNFIVFPFCYNPSQLFTAFLYSSVK